MPVIKTVWLTSSVKVEPSCWHVNPSSSEIVVELIAHDDQSRDETVTEGCSKSGLWVWARGEVRPVESEQFTPINREQVRTSGCCGSGREFHLGNFFSLFKLEDGELSSVQVDGDLQFTEGIFYVLKLPLHECIVRVAI